MSKHQKSSKGDLPKASVVIHSEDQKGEHQHSGRPHPPVISVPTETSPGGAVREASVDENPAVLDAARKALYLSTGRTASGQSVEPELKGYDA